MRGIHRRVSTSEIESKNVEEEPTQSLFSKAKHSYGSSHAHQRRNVDPKAKEDTALNKKSNVFTGSSVIFGASSETNFDSNHENET